jgi:hypothetical protein
VAGEGSAKLLLVNAGKCMIFEGVDSLRNVVRFCSLGALMSEIYAYHYYIDSREFDGDSLG